MADRDSAGLPYTEKEQIKLLQREYENSAARGGRDAVDKCFNLTWSLVHSRDKSDVQRGLEFVDALLSSEGTEQRELLYLKGVGQFRSYHHVAARATLKEAIDKFPDFRQAESLLDAVESEIVKDGMVGVGIGAAIVGVIAAVAVGAMRKR